MATEGDPKGSGTAEEPAVPPPTESTAAASAETTDWESRFRYLLADFDNFRRRTERDRAGARTEAEAVLLRRLIPLVEGFRQAEAAARTLPASDPLRRGLELLGHELQTVLRSVGFVPVAEVGEAFRPDEHEAVGEVTAPRGVGEGQVAEIVQQGYRFQGGLLRPAKVLVARSSTAPPGASHPQPDAAVEPTGRPTAEEDSP